VVLDPDTSMNPYTLSRHYTPPVRRCWRGPGDAREVRASLLQRAAPGPHAERNRAMAFVSQQCGVGAATRHGRARLERIAILDFDVHHGNGTEDIFARMRAFCSARRFSIRIIHTAAPAPTAEHVINTPLAAGFRRDAVPAGGRDDLASGTPKPSNRNW